MSAIALERPRARAVAAPGIGQFVARAKFGEELKPERATAAA